MRFLRNLSIGRKLIAITVATSGVALLIACAAFAIHEHNNFRKSMARDLATITDIFEENVASGLAFGDASSMEQTLNTLRNDHRILAAAVYDKAGELLASYQREDQEGKFEYPAGLSLGQRFSDTRLDTFKEIDLAGEIIGVVYIGAELRELRERAWRYLMIVGILLVGCSLVALALASRLHRFISDPIRSLAATADSIAVGQDFSRRAVKQGDDEVGHLVDGFNKMLSQIQVRDNQLQAARDDLERRVEDRTAALVHEVRERTEAETALARSHSVLNATLESTIDGIMVIGSDGRVKHFNQRFAKIWGVEPDFLMSGNNHTVLGFVARQLKDPSAFLRHTIRIHRDPTAEQSTVLEFKDGRIIELYSRPQQSDGISTGRVWSVRDITERKRIEAEIAYERDLLQVLMNTVPDLLYFKDLESRFVRVSRSKLEETLRILREAHCNGSVPDGAREFPPHLKDIDTLFPWIIGKTDLDVFVEGEASQMFREESEIIRTGEPMKGKIESITLPSGEPCWYLVSKMPWRNGDGRIIGTYGISKNITPIKVAEEELKKVHEQLLKASRQAGMAEVATGVLHNVGNVLNSVNVSAGILRETLRASEVSTLSRVAALMRDHDGDIDEFLTKNPKGRMLPKVVMQLADQLGKEHATLNAEQEHLSRNVEHIKSIVAMQQNFATVSGVLEKVRLVDLLRDVVQMHSASIARMGIEIIRDYADLPPMILDKHKVVQILVNLVTNAKHAIDDAQRTGGQIKVSLRLVGDNRVRISISDNGVGIPADNLTRIFSHGFTTRHDGHGFGLHSGALAAREMGGSLSV
ncbi:MAG TPA: PAS domain S-box protein, partial [Opitutaceae bacterium]|nr:PAS domain S-box protein [Opitutaceae bacterium]